MERWVTGLGVLRAAVAETTPEWAESRTGIPAQEIRAFVREVAAAAPRVLRITSYNVCYTKLLRDLFVRTAPWAWYTPRPFVSTLEELPTSYTRHDAG